MSTMPSQLMSPRMHEPGTGVRVIVGVGVGPVVNDSTQPLKGVEPSKVALLHCCWTRYLWPFRVTLPPSAAIVPKRKLHLSEISPLTSESNQALKRGSFVASNSSWAIKLISASAGVFPFGGLFFADEDTQPGLPFQVFTYGMFDQIMGPAVKNVWYAQKWSVAVVMPGVQ